MSYPRCPHCREDLPGSFTLMEVGIIAGIAFIIALLIGAAAGEEFTAKRFEKARSEYVY